MSQYWITADWAGLGGPRRVGTVRVSTVRGREVVAVAFAPDWLARQGGLILDPLLSPVTGWQHPAQAGFPGILRDSAPDRWGRMLLRRHEAELARSEARPTRPLTEMDYLLGVSDRTRLGALRFQADPAGPFLAEPTERDIPPLATLRKLESMAVRLDADPEVHLEEDIDLLLAPGSSLGGARPKATVADPGGQWWVAKFPSSRDEIDVGAWESLTQDLARMCGLRTAPSQVRKFSRRGHTFLIQRFDRVGADRLHYASAMCLLGAKDGDGAATGLGYLDLADLIQRVGASPDEDLPELWRRILFGILVGNTDDHLRNHGFLLGPTGWRLSPLFDVNPSPWGGALALNVTESGNDLDVALPLEVATHFRVSRDEAERHLAEFRKTVGHWRAWARERGLPQSQISLMERAFRLAS